MATGKKLLKSYLCDVQNQREVNLNNYEKKSLIGHGAFANVYLIEKKDSHEQFAAKVSLGNDLPASKAFLREVNVLLKIKHPTILPFHGFCLTDFDGQDHPILLTSYQPNGSLRSLFDLEARSLAPPDWDMTKKYISLYGIARGMQYIHESSYIHRDLKPSNILLTDRLFPLISDFGLTKWYHPDSSEELTLCGTPRYTAPEIIRGENNYNTSVDVYSYGLIMFEMLTCIAPYESLAKKSNLISAKIVDGYRPEFPNGLLINEQLRELIERCWSGDPLERPTFKEIIEILRDNSLITELGVDNDDFENYAEMVDSQDASKLTNADIDRTLSQIRKVDLSQSLEQIKEPGMAQLLVFPPSEFATLEERCQRIVQMAETGNSTMMMAAANSLLQGKNGFPKNTEYGIKFLKNSVALNNIEASSHSGRKALPISRKSPPSDDRRRQKKNVKLI